MKQKTIVITGSTRGIGFGLAKEFLTLGHKIVINGRMVEKLSKAISELENINPDLIGVVGSVSLNETHVSIVEKATSEFGKIDIWINNAGIPQAHKMFVDIDDTELNKIIDTNIYGLMFGTRIAALFSKSCHVFYNC